MNDHKEISKFAKILGQHFENGIYFEEFQYLCREVTSELYFSIFNCIYNTVPFIKIAFSLR